MLGLNLAAGLGTSAPSTGRSGKQAVAGYWCLLETFSIA